VKRHIKISAIWLLAWLLSMVAALLPLVKGRPVNWVFLAAGAVFLLMAIVTAQRRPPRNPHA
jgi:membrane protein YdbS with pleckstrin-like domain